MASEKAAFTIAVVFEDAQRERFVMAKHAERGWEIPGGHIEPDESPLEAGVREFAEETGHTILDAELVLQQDREVGHCTVITGLLGPAKGEGEGGVAPDEAITEWRFVERITDVAPLAFPEDPYEEIGQALGVSLT